MDSVIQRQRRVKQASAVDDRPEAPLCNVHPVSMFEAAAVFAVFTATLKGRPQAGYQVSQAETRVAVKGGAA